jgi:flap endonuclease-1
VTPLIGIGRQKAFTLIKEHGSIETILKHLDKKRYPVPDDWPFAEARELFKKPDVKPAKDCVVG